MRRTIISIVAAGLLAAALTMPAGTQGSKNQPKARYQQQSVSGKVPGVNLTKSAGLATLGAAPGRPHPTG